DDLDTSVGGLLMGGVGACAGGLGRAAGLEREHGRINVALLDQECADSRRTLIGKSVEIRNGFGVLAERMAADHDAVVAAADDVSDLAEVAERLRLENSRAEIEGDSAADGEARALVDCRDLRLATDHVADGALVDLLHEMSEEGRLVHSDEGRLLCVCIARNGPNTALVTKCLIDGL